MRHEALPPPPPEVAAVAGSSLGHLLGTAERLAVVDVETTGLYRSDRIVEIGVVTLDPGGAVVEAFETLVNPGRDVGPTWLHKVTASMVADAPMFHDVAHHVASRLDGAIVVGHNLPFDQRMLTAEFAASGIDIHWGNGLDTLRVTGCKLGVACSEHGVPLGADAHSAVADALATAQLLLAVAQAFPYAGQAATARPLEVRPMRVHTRVGLTQVEAPAPYLAALAQGVHATPDTAPYVALLDQAIADLKLTADERLELNGLATDLGLDPARIARAHRDFIGDLIDAALEDLIVTEHEYEQLCRAAALLDVDVDLVAQRTDKHRSVGSDLVLTPGLQVCFTGVAIDQHGSELPRSELEVIARARGLVPTQNVTSKACDLLVASDPASRSGKAGKARKFGIPIASVPDFLATYGSGDTLPVSRLASAGVALVCSQCGASWLATRSSSKPTCADCKATAGQPKASTAEASVPPADDSPMAAVETAAATVAKPTIGVDVPIGPRGCPIAWTNHFVASFDGLVEGAVVLELRPEPDNPHNPQAIAVRLHGGAQIGYLPNWILEDYASGFHALCAEGPVVATASVHRRESGWEAELNLMEPDYFYRWIAAAPQGRATMATRQFNMKLAGTKDCLDAIGDALGRSTTEKRVPAEIRSIPTPSGKYQGQPRLDFFHGDRKIGHLLPTRQDQIPGVFRGAAASPVDATVVIEHSSSGNHRVFFRSEGRM